MRTTAFLKQAAREAQFVDALLLARYALVTHDGLTILGDDEEASRWAVDFSFELRRIDAVLPMAGIDTTQTLPAPLARPHDDNDDAQRLGE